MDRKKEYEEFLQLYNKKYPKDGPSISSSSHRIYRNKCGCWHCQYLKLKGGEIKCGRKKIKIFLQESQNIK